MYIRMKQHRHTDTVVVINDHSTLPSLPSEGCIVIFFCTVAASRVQAVMCSSSTELNERFPLRCVAQRPSKLATRRESLISAPPPRHSSNAMRAVLLLVALCASVASAGYLYADSSLDFGTTFGIVKWSM